MSGTSTRVGVYMNTPIADDNIIIGVAASGLVDQRQINNGDLVGSQRFKIKKLFPSFSSKSMICAITLT
jgi:hypothetical protein